MAGLEGMVCRGLVTVANTPRPALTRARTNKPQRVRSRDTPHRIYLSEATQRSRAAPHRDYRGCGSSGMGEALELPAGSAARSADAQNQ